MVTQLQYTAWPDHDVPKSAEPLIEMNKTLSSLQGSKKQQVLVHCRSVKVVNRGLDSFAMPLLFCGSAYERTGKHQIQECDWLKARTRFSNPD